MLISNTKKLNWFFLIFLFTLWLEQVSSPKTQLAWKRILHMRTQVTCRVTFSIKMSAAGRVQHWLKSSRATAALSTWLDCGRTVVNNLMFWRKRLNYWAKVGSNKENFKNGFSFENVLSHAPFLLLKNLLLELSKTTRDYSSIRTFAVQLGHTAMLIN